MIYCECGWPEPSGMCPSCNQMKRPQEPNPEETEARSQMNEVVSWWAGITEDLDRTKYAK